MPRLVHPTRTTHEQRVTEEQVVQCLEPFLGFLQASHAQANEVASVLPVIRALTEAQGGEEDDAAGRRAAGLKQTLLDARLMRPDGSPRLLRAETVAYLRQGLAGLSADFVALDASRPWLIYWISHALELLNAPAQEMYGSMLDTLKRCRDRERGGFGGGPGQLPHTAPTYAAVLALVEMGTRDALQALLEFRPWIYKFFMSLKNADGSFRVQEDGETDSRGMYTVLCVASILNMLTPELARGCAEWVALLQTFEGGFGGEPGNEAHGGYAFCALASLVILNRFDTVDLGAFTRWLADRQMALEGGFQGRANKLVDSCYSFWQGAAPALLQLIQASPRAPAPPQVASGDAGGDELVYDRIRLQEYIVLCCSHLRGGLRDKPGKSRDYYHTCYSLSGMAVAQHGASRKHFPGGEGGGAVVLGDSEENLLCFTDPVCNVVGHKLGRSRSYFARAPSSHADLEAAASQGAFPG